MFGYVSIYKDELKIKDYNIWRSYYCSLCKCLGKKYNTLVRLGLSYDMTFLAVLISSLCDEETDINWEHCIIHPLTKRPVQKTTKALSYVADVSVVLVREKQKDDIKDDKSVKAFVLGLPYILPYKKAKNHINVAEIQKCLNNLSRLEKENCKDIDIVAHEFANITKELLCPDFIREDSKETLQKFGYNLGRWIYILDAVNDFSQDKKKGSYNPFDRIDKNRIEFNLTYTLSQISDCYMKLDFKRNKALIENIIFLGLRCKQEEVLGKKGAEINESI